MHGVSPCPCWNLVFQVVLFYRILSVGFVRKRVVGVIFSLFILACVFVILSILNFYRVLQQKEVILQEGVLHDLARFTSGYMDVKLEGYLSTLYGLADFILLRDVRWETIHERLTTIISRQEFQHLGLSSLDGEVWATDGVGEFTIDITGRGYWQELLDGKAVVTDAQDSLVTENQIFVVAVPITNREGKVVGIVHGAVSLNEFQGYEASRFEMESYLVFVVDYTGSYILRDHKYPESWQHDSIFDGMEDVDGGKGTTEFKQQLQEGLPVQTTATILGKEYILCFSPLSINKWYTVVLMPKDEINKHIEVLLDDDINILMLCIIIPLILLCVAFFYIIRKKIKTERNKEYQLREKLFSDIEGFIQADLNEDRVVYCSQSLGLPSVSMPFSHLIDLYIHSRVDEVYQERLGRILTIDNLMEMNAQGIGRISQEYKAKDKNEKLRWFQCDIHIESGVDSEPNVLYFILRNIDEKKKMEAALKTKAERDSLTGLYNRSTATDLINVFLHLNTHSPKVNHAFIILDLDNFKVLNDTLLHKTGDKALQDVAGILTNFFRKEDIVCRLGGDEFVVFLKHIAHENIEKKMMRLMKELHLVYTQGDKSVSISASAGVAIAPANGTTFRDLYVAADRALYQAKQAGKATFMKAPLS